MDKGNNCCKPPTLREMGQINSIEQRIIELQNAKSATEVTEQAVFFTLILESNEKMAERTKELLEENKRLTKENQKVGNDKRALEEYIMKTGWEEYLKDEK